MSEPINMPCPEPTDDAVAPESIEEDLRWITGAGEYGLKVSDRLRARIAALEAVARTLCDAIHGLDEAASDEWSGDYFHMSCLLCGTDWDRSNREHHETRCPIPELRERRQAALDALGGSDE